MALPIGRVWKVNKAHGSSPESEPEIILNSGSIKLLSLHDTWKLGPGIFLQYNKYLKQ